MDKKRFLLVFVLFFLASAVVVADVFEDVLGFEAGDFYQDYFIFIDFCIYLAIFVGLAQVVFHDRFGNRAGRAVIIGLGVALSLGMIVWSVASGFNLGDIGPLAVVVLLIIFGFFLFRVLSQIAGVPAYAAGAFTYLVIYFFARAISPTFFSWLDNSVELISVILRWGVLVAVILLIIYAWRMISSVWSSTRPAGSAATGGAGTGTGGGGTGGGGTGGGTGGTGTGGTGTGGTGTGGTGTGGTGTGGTGTGGTGTGSTGTIPPPNRAQIAALQNLIRNQLVPQATIIGGQMNTLHAFDQRQVRAWLPKTRTLGRWPSVQAALAAPTTPPPPAPAVPGQLTSRQKAQIRHRINNAIPRIGSNMANIGNVIQQIGGDAQFQNVPSSDRRIYTNTLRQLNRGYNQVIGTMNYLTH